MNELFQPSLIGGLVALAVVPVLVLKAWLTYSFSVHEQAIKQWSLIATALVGCFWLLYIWHFSDWGDNMIEKGGSMLHFFITFLNVAAGIAAGYLLQKTDIMS